MYRIVVSKGALVVSLIPLCAIISTSGSTQSAERFQLGLVLKGVRAYCRQIERAALDFVCLEEISEKVDLSHQKQQGVRVDPRIASGVGGVGRMGLSGRLLSYNPDSTPTKGNHLYVFDYQFIRKQGRFQENRVLLEKDGKKAKTKGKQPQVAVFSCSEILLLPARLLDERVAEYYDYYLLGEGHSAGTKTWILKVTPRLSIGGYLGGTILINQADSSILKIEWDPTTFGRYAAILQNAVLYEATPEIGRAHV
jgi:hypothetical protein